jgi:hypothetical protein
MENSQKPIITDVNISINYSDSWKWIKTNWELIKESDFTKMKCPSPLFPIKNIYFPKELIEKKLEIAGKLFQYQKLTPPEKVLSDMSLERHCPADIFESAALAATNPELYQKSVLAVLGSGWWRPDTHHGKPYFSIYYQHCQLWHPMEGYLYFPSCYFLAVPGNINLPLQAFKKTEVFSFS